MKSIRISALSLITLAALSGAAYAHGNHAAAGTANAPGSGCPMHATGGGGTPGHALHGQAMPGHGTQGRMMQGHMMQGRMMQGHPMHGEQAMGRGMGHHRGAPAPQQ